MLLFPYDGFTVIIFLQFHWTDPVSQSLNMFLKKNEAKNVLMV